MSQLSSTDRDFFFEVGGYDGGSGILSAMVLGNVHLRKRSLGMGIWVLSVTKTKWSGGYWTPLMRRCVCCFSYIS